MKMITKNKNGFSLTETLVAVFVFSLVAVLLAGSFAGFFKSYADAKKTQKALESAQFAMNLMAKTLRTSEVFADTASWPLSGYDYSQGKCIQYNYSGNDLTIETVAALSPSACATATYSTPSNLTNGDIDAAYVNATASAGATKGKVTISLIVKEPNQTIDVLPIQMTVSLRQ